MLNGELRNHCMGILLSVATEIELEMHFHDQLSIINQKSISRTLIADYSQIKSLIVNMEY